MRSYHNELKEYVKDYGAKDPHIEGAGKHLKLVFWLNGRWYREPCASSPSDPNALEHAKRDLRNKLGQRVEPPTKQRRKLEEMDLRDMVPPPQTMASISTLPLEAMGVFAPKSSEEIRKMSEGKMAMYAKGHLRFDIPKDIIDVIGTKGMFEYKRIDHDTWQLSPAPEGGYGPGIRKESHRWILDITRGKIDEVSEGIAPFGMSPAQFVYFESEKAILVTLPPEDKRKPVKDLGVAGKPRRARFAPQPQPPKVAPTPPWHETVVYKAETPMPVAPSTKLPQEELGWGVEQLLVRGGFIEDNIRAVLRAVQWIDKESNWTLRVLQDKDGQRRIVFDPKTGRID